MDQMFRRNSDVFAAPLEDTTLLLNAATGRYHGLNPVAARIWELLVDPMDEAMLINRLLVEFDVTPEDCQREVAVFLAGLRERGLLTND